MAIKPQSLRKFLLIFAVVWMTIGLILAALAFGGVISKSIFEWVFLGGFVVFAVVAGLLSRVLVDIEGSKNGSSEKSGSES